MHALGTKPFRRAGGVLAVALLAGALGPAGRGALPVPQQPFYQPRIFVSTAELQAGPAPAQGLTGLGFERDLGATAKLVLFAPEGVSVQLDQAPGTLLGTPGVRIDVPGTTLAFEPRAGSIVAADPASYATDPQAQACAPGVHTAVWVLKARATKNYRPGPPPKLTITLPIYVDQITPSQANMYSTYELQICFGSPATTETTSGWPAGATIRRLTLNLSQGVAAEQAASPGIYLWRGLFTSYTPSGQPSPAPAVESRAIFVLPVQVALHGSDLPGRKTIEVSGAVTQGGVPVAGGDVLIWHGTSLAANWPGIANVKRASVRTSAQGRFSLPIPATRTTYVRASLTTPSAGYVDSTGCAGPSPAPGGCVTATQLGFQVRSAIVTVAVPRSVAARRDGR